MINQTADTGYHPGAFTRGIGRLGLSPIGLVAFILGLAVFSTIENELDYRLLSSSLMYGALAISVDFTCGYINIV